MRLPQENKLKVPSRVLAAAEFVPFNGRAADAAVRKARPSLSREDAKRMLGEPLGVCLLA